MVILEKYGQCSILMKHKIGCLQFPLVYHHVLIPFSVYSLKYLQKSPQLTSLSEPQSHPEGLYNQSKIECLIITKEHILRIKIMKSSTLVFLAHF